MKKRTKVNLYRIALFTLLAAVIGVVIYAIWRHDVLTEDFSSQYATDVQEGNFTVVICRAGNGERANVRTEPLAATHKVIHGLPGGYMNEHYSVESEGVVNCLGKVRDPNGTGVVLHVEHAVYVTRSWWDDYSFGDEWNGPYVGIMVSDLSKDELKLFPGLTSKDEDGIVWISSKYLEIY